MIACPACGNDTTVTDTRQSDGFVRRRRRCVSVVCNRRVTTAEIVVSDAASDDEVRRALIGGPVIIPRADVERITLLLATSLGRRIGQKAMAELLAGVLPAAPTGKDKDHGSGESTDR